MVPHPCNRQIRRNLSVFRLLGVCSCVEYALQALDSAVLLGSDLCDLSYLCGVAAADIIQLAA
jgi:hypothetical protein